MLNENLYERFMLLRGFVGKMASRQKERVLTSPKTSTLAFISVLPWRINDGMDTNCQRPEVGCSKLVKPLRGCNKSLPTSHKSDELPEFVD